MNQLASKTLLSALAAFALLLGTSTFAAAQKSASSKNEAERYTYVPFAGQTVAIDRQTGKLRPPTADEARQLGAALKNYLNRSGQGLTVKTHPNGVQSVDLQGRFQSVSLAKVNADGSTSEKCVTNMQEAQDFLATPSAKHKSSASPASKANPLPEEK
jgi:NADH dehydrogenase FAD-containing subunit